ncbi:protein RNA-directed DNA methylation 3 [Tanacetum coccineum]
MAPNVESEEARIAKDVEANLIRFNKELEKHDIVGREKHSAVCIMQKCVDLKSIGTRLQIVFAFDLEHVKGFSLEAEEGTDAFIGYNLTPKVLLGSSKWMQCQHFYFLRMEKR